MSEAERIPVIVGVGQINDRPDDPMQGLDSYELMRAALELADNDAGGGWLARAGMVGLVRQISFPGMGNLAERLIDDLGIAPRFVEQTPGPMGESPVRLLNDAANRIGAGEIEVAILTGGEALRTAAGRAKLAAAAATERGEAAPKADPLRRAAEGAPADERARYGLVAPVDVYPLYENACRAAWGQSLAEGQAESGAIWSRFSEVAADCEHAWLREARPAEAIVTPSPGNRPIAFPYTKLQVANSSVNQGAGVIVASLAAARAAGIAEDRLVHLGPGAAAHEADDILARDSFAHSRGMEESLTRALAANGIGAEDCDFAELYSCFPCVPKMARRTIGWPMERAASVFGGLTFGGGPIGNYMMHAIACMTEKLREGGQYGLLFANGGYATHNHVMVLRREPMPAGTFPQDYHVQQAADARRDPVPPLAADYTGPGTVETYTVMYDRDGAAKFGVVVARAPSGERFLARVPAEDAATIAFLTDGSAEPVGSTGEAVAGETHMLWRRR